MICELNLVMATALVLLAGYISWSHLRERGIRSPLALVGTTVLVLTLTILTATIPAGLHLEPSEVYRFVAGLLMGVALVLLGGYALHRHLERGA